MNIKPLGTNVLLEKSGIKTAVSSTIIVPESAAKDHYEYRIVAVGPKVPSEIKPGLRVVCSPWEGKDLEHEGKALRLVDYNHCQMLIGVEAV